MNDLDNSFDTVFKQFKDNTKPMCELMGCSELVDDFIVDVEINRQSFKSFYEAGQKSKQAEVDELRKNFNNALKTIEIQQRFLDDADGANEIATSRVGELQNKIDEALKLLNLAYPESWAYCVDEAINILKGNKDEN